MYEFVESSKRGGLVTANHRLSQTQEGIDYFKNLNLKHVRETSGKMQPNILYLDGNNLYAECLRGVQPHHSFEWIEVADCKYLTSFFQLQHAAFNDNKEQISWGDFFDNHFDNPIIRKKGKLDKDGHYIPGTEEEMFMFLELDIKYPENLHDEHNDFPLAPALYEICENNVSKKSKHLINKNNKKGGAKNTKLKNYVVHFSPKKIM